MKTRVLILLLLITTALPALAAPGNTSGPWGIWIGSGSGFTSLSTAKRSPVTANKTMVIDSVMTCNNLTIPADRALEVRHGGKIRYSGNLVINGPFSAGQYQVLERVGSGTVTFNSDVVNPNGWFSNGAVVTFNAGLTALPTLISSAMVLGAPARVSEVYAEWWGAVGDYNGTTGTDDSAAVQSAITNSYGTSQYPAYSRKLIVLGKKYLVGNLECYGNIEINGVVTSLFGVSSGWFAKNGATRILKIDGTRLEDRDYYGDSSYINAGSNSYRLYGVRINNMTFHGRSQALESLVWVRAASYLQIKGSGFSYSNGAGLLLTDVMESTIADCLFTNAGTTTKGSIHFMNSQGTNQDGTPNHSNNVNNLHIEHNTFSGAPGPLVATDNYPWSDTIWFSNNKCEWDRQADWKTTNSVNAIDIKWGGKMFISHNIFYGYNSTRYYASVLKLGGQGPWTITDNKMNNVDGTNWMDLTNMTGYLYEKENTWQTSASSLPTYVGTGVGQVAGKKPQVLDGNTNYKTMQVLTVGELIPAISLFGAAVSTTFGEVVAGALAHGGLCRAYAGGVETELARLLMGNFKGHYATTVRIHARVRSYNPAANSSMRADHSTGSPVLGNIAVPYASGWMWVKWDLPVANITDTSYVTLYSTAGVYIDSVMIQLL